jgi:hypothetical protein
MALSSKRANNAMESKTGDQVKRVKTNGASVKLEEKPISTKLEQFRSEPLENNVDYISLQSSLSLLRSRLYDIKHDIRDLKGLKQTIKASDDTKTIAKLISSNTNYLKEISYKGCHIKCPEIDWKNDYDINLDELKTNEDDEALSKINDNYEILKRDEIFGFK